MTAEEIKNIKIESNEIKLLTREYEKYIYRIYKVKNKNIMRIKPGINDEIIACKIAECIPNARIGYDLITNRYSQTSREYFIDVPF